MFQMNNVIHGLHVFLVVHLWKCTLTVVLQTKNIFIYVSFNWNHYTEEVFTLHTTNTCILMALDTLI